MRAGRGDALGAGPCRPSVPRPPAPLARPQLQEQLQRLLLVNAELRQKLAAVQTQLRAARDRGERTRAAARKRAVELPPEPVQGQAAGPECEQRRESERATAGTSSPGDPREDPVSAL